MASLGVVRVQYIYIYIYKLFQLLSGASDGD